MSEITVLEDPVWQACFAEGAPSKLSLIGEVVDGEEGCGGGEGALSFGRIEVSGDE